jgi:hypothetical protein
MKSQSHSLALVPVVPAQGFTPAQFTPNPTPVTLPKPKQATGDALVSKLARGGHLASSFPMSVFVLAVLFAPGHAAGEQAYAVATEVMMSDITNQLLLTSLIAGDSVSTGTTGLWTINSAGSAYGFSFTAGGGSVTDTATLAPDGIAPGTGTWTIDSNILTTATAQVTYDSTSTSYTIALSTTFPPVTPPPGGVPYTDTKIIYRYFLLDGSDIAAGRWSRDDGTTSPMIFLGSDAPLPNWYANSTPDSPSILSISSGPNGSFTGMANVVPEPPASILFLSGVALTALCVGTHRVRQVQ